MSTETLYSALITRYGDKVRRNEPLANHTTLRLGGPAELWLAVETVEQLIEAVQLAQGHQIPVFILGGGANLLIRDGGLKGLVVENRAGGVQFPAEKAGEKGEQVKVVVESGVTLPNLARRCAKRGLSGMEWAVGIPGTIGGAVVNNAGAYNSDMAGTLGRAEVLFLPSPQPSPRGRGGDDTKYRPSLPVGGTIWQTVEWFDYSYRSSRLKRQNRDGGQWLILRAELEMVRASANEVQGLTTKFNEQRKASQPPGATIGSMFKNPPDDYAGRLIEAVGLKGYRCGQAQISPVHANFFQNLGGATATEVLTLIQTAQTVVADQFGISLELEIEVIGDEA